MATDPLCYLCGLPADRGPYVLRLDVYPSPWDTTQPYTAPCSRATSCTMNVCRLCDTSPALLEQLAARIGRGPGNLPVPHAWGTLTRRDRWAAYARMAAGQDVNAVAFADQMMSAEDARFGHG